SDLVGDAARGVAGAAARGDGSVCDLSVDHPAVFDSDAEVLGEERGDVFGVVGEWGDSAGDCGSAGAGGGAEHSRGASGVAGAVCDSAAGSGMVGAADGSAIAVDSVWAGAGGVEQCDGAAVSGAAGVQLFGVGRCAGVDLQRVFGVVDGGASA